MPPFKLAVGREDSAMGMRIRARMAELVDALV